MLCQIRTYRVDCWADQRPIASANLRVANEFEVSAEAVTRSVDKTLRVGKEAYRPAKKCSPSGVEVMMMGD